MRQGGKERKTLSVDVGYGSYMRRTQRYDSRRVSTDQQFQGLLATKGKTGKTSAPPTPSTAGPDSKVTPPASAGADGGVQESSAS